MKKIIISFLAIIMLFSCKKDGQHIVKIEGKLLPVSEEFNPQKDVEDIIKPYKEKVEKEMNIVISYTPVDLVKTDGDLESSLGNLMADICYQKANPVFNSRTGKNIDFAIFNYGGIRAGIPKGEITNQHAFKLMPFENYLVVVELTADKINEMVNYLIEGNRAHPLSKHINIIINEEGYDLKINNLAIDKNKTYFVLTTDYLQNLGDNMNHFKNPVAVYKLDYKMRNAIIDYLKEVDTVEVLLDGRFRKEN